MRDHGGDIDAAMTRYGGGVSDWLDLSTGINRLPYPVPPIETDCWSALPRRSAIDELHSAAAVAYGTTSSIVALAGAQMAIQIMPLLHEPGRARILSPTYNEHAAAFRAHGWQVDEVVRFDDLENADIAVVVNPNNPDGRRSSPQRLLALSKRVKHLIIDESFADAEPDLSLAAHAGQSGLIVLRSFGKFYGLAGLRLGFVMAASQITERIASLAGPWPISGAAIAIGKAALSDHAWTAATRARLQRDVPRVDSIAAKAGWTLTGGTPLFRLYETGSAEAAKDRLARHKIWSRSFPWSHGALRLGVPGPEVEWQRLENALRS